SDRSPKNTPTLSPAASSRQPAFFADATFALCPGFVAFRPPSRGDGERVSTRRLQDGHTGTDCKRTRGTRTRGDLVSCTQGVSRVRRAAGVPGGGGSGAERSAPAADNRCVLPDGGAGSAVARRRRSGGQVRAEAIAASSAARVRAGLPHRHRNALRPRPPA